MPPGGRTAFPPAFLPEPWLVRREEEGAFVFDPFPGGRVFRLSASELAALDYLLSGGLAPPPSPGALSRFLVRSRAFLRIPPAAARLLSRGRPPGSEAASGEPLPPKGPASLPLRLSFLVTDECARACPWCCVRIAPPGEGLSRCGWIFPAPGELASLASPGGTGFHLHGGEPLLCAGLPAFTAFLSGCGFVVSLSTRLLPPTSFWRDMSRAGLVLLQLSWDISRAGLGPFASSVAAARSAGLDVVVNVVMSVANVRRASADMLRIVLDAGADEIRFTPLQPSLHRPDALRYAASPDETAALAERVGHLRGVVLENAFPVPPESCEPDPVSLCLAADGFAYPCDRVAFLPRYRLADWRADGLLAAWETSRSSLRPFRCPFGEGKAV